LWLNTNHIKRQQDQAAMCETSEGNKTKEARTSKTSCTSPTTFIEKGQNSTYNKLCKALAGVTQQFLTNQHTT
jgi:hypothetical protein